MEMPRETKTLEGFEVWDRTVQAPEHQEKKVAFVSVRVGGNIGMNRAAYEMWGAPGACKVMFDPKRRRIGLKPADPEEANSWRLSRWSPIQISCKKFFEFYSIDVPETRRYHDPKVVDGVLVINL